jgi:hypothetical protein
MSEDNHNFIGPCLGSKRGWCQNLSICTNCIIPDGYCPECQKEHHDEILAEVTETLRKLEDELKRGK